MTEKSTTTALQPRQPLNIDMKAGVGISNYNEAMQMAALVHDSGLAPRSLDTVQKVAVAMLMAIETGLPVVTGLQNIAVVNGKAGIWGDGVLSLVRASGQMEAGYPKEWVEGQPFTDGWTFYCTVKRKGGPEVTGSFSWAEAKRAGFDSPTMRNGQKDPYSPWTRFPRRMMQWKARQWVYRDVFGDILRGMRMAEELHDFVEMEETDSGYSLPVPAEQPQVDMPAVEESPTFEELLPDDIDRAQVEKYALACAEHFKKPVEVFKAEIIANDQLEDFLNAFRGWEKKNPPDDMDQTENGQQAQAELSGGPKEAADPWQEFRSEFINLRSSGFSTWVFKNKARLADAPEEIRDEARGKWMKLYAPNPWPLDPETEEQAEPDPMAEQEAAAEIPAAWDMPDICETYIQKLGKGVAMDIMGTDNPAQVPQEDRLAVIEALRKAAENEE